MHLQLDPDFRPMPGMPTMAHVSSVFPGGEPHIRIAPLPPGTDHVWVSHRVRSFNDMGLLLLAVDALQRMRVAHIRLVLPYFPAARQDRLMTPGESLACKVYADLLNRLGLEEVVIFDPHSDVAPALLDRCTRVTNHLFIQQVLAQLPERPWLVSPDAGAAKKVHELAKALGGQDVLECGKTRDPITGALSGYKVPSADLQGRTCLVVDDICDGGGTFIGLGDELHRCGAGDLHLAVSHGLFSKGTDALLQRYRSVFTTDSMPALQPADTTTIPLSTCLPSNLFQRS